MYFCMCILSGKGSWTYLKLNFLRVLNISAPTPQNGQTHSSNVFDYCVWLTCKGLTPTSSKLTQKLSYF